MEHSAYYDLVKEIEKKVKSLSDEDIYFAYWLNYGNSNEGLFENAIGLEYAQRKW